MDLPEPTRAATDRAEVLLRYLDFFRDVVLTRTGALDEARSASSLLPSGWTPLELARHLTFVERRWQVPDGMTRDGVLAGLRQRGERTRAIVRAHDLDDVGLAASGRWDGAPPTTLERVMLHLLQEHARHCGHLDIVVELARGPTGE